MNPNPTTIIGSRGSDLALWQAHYLQDQLRDLGFNSDIRIIQTKGDKIQNLSFDKIEGKGFFTKEIEEALLQDEIDIAVHSCKDLPTENPPGLIIGAVSYRENPADILLIRPGSIDDSLQFQLKKGAVVGTSSARRKNQLLFFRPDLKFRDIRGNVPTRIRKLFEQDLDAVVLAAAGIDRLKLDAEPAVRVDLDPSVIVPAPAQGVLAFQVRLKDARMMAICEKLNTPRVRSVIKIEREFLNAMGGGCHMPLGSFARSVGDTNEIRISTAANWNDIPVRMFFTNNNPKDIGKKIAGLVSSLPLAGKSVFISRDLKSDSHFRQYLVSLGWQVEGASLIKFEKIEFPEVKDTYSWIFFPGKNAVRYFLDGHKGEFPENVKIAAMGEGTANFLRSKGLEVNFSGSSADPSQVAQEFYKYAGGQIVLVPRASNSSRSMQEALKDKCDFIDLPVYQNTVNTEISPIQSDVVVITSSLNFKALVSSGFDFTNSIKIAIGPATAAAMLDEGIPADLIAPATNEHALAEAVMGSLLL